MKKFSSISDYSVPSEPQIKIEKPDKNVLLKDKLLSLMNELLKIQSTGSARTELINSAITISGKESLADAIIDLITSESSTDKVKLLESMKLEMNDWFYLDNKIEKLNSQVIQEKNQRNSNIERKLLAFIDIYGEEKDYELHTEMLINRINKKNDLIDRISIAESILMKNKLNQKQSQQIKLLIEKMKQRVNK